MGKIKTKQKPDNSRADEDVKYLELSYTLPQNMQNGTVSEKQFGHFLYS